jgi:hypothetical protein
LVLKAFILLIIFLVFSFVGSAYAHKAQVVGDYKIEVGWKNEPPLVGIDNAIEIIVTVATEHDKESHETKDHEMEHMEHEEDMKHEEHQEGMEHEKQMEAGTPASGLADKLEATVSLKEKKTPLVLVESSIGGVYHADYTPTEAGFPLVNLVGKIGSVEFEITFHPEKIEGLSALPPLKQVKVGISEDKVECKSNLELIFHPSSGDPACVKQTSIQRLLQIGWILA